MPNWCENSLEIMGPADAVEEFKLFVKDSLSAKKFIPYPEEFKLLDEVAGRYRKTLNSLPEALRHNIASITGYYIEDGYNSGGYEWCIRNWGTKWDFCEVELKLDMLYKDKNERELVYIFDTAWSPPLPVIEKMGQMFPDLNFDLRYYEENVGYHGMYIINNNKLVAKGCGEYYGKRCS